MEINKQIIRKLVSEARDYFEERWKEDLVRILLIK